MRTVRSISKLFSALILVLSLVMLSTGCSKKCDDHAQPQDNTSTGSNRAPVEVPAVDGGTHSQNTVARGMEGSDVDGDQGSGGISDDGDDEADGEGSNKKGRH
jgi:hypothetical protein